MTDSQAAVTCPFCGNDEVDAEGWLDGNGNRGPECLKCGATAPTLEVWNKRTPPPCQSDASEKSDVLYDSAYIAGLKAGWNFGVAENDQGFNKAIESRAGYLKALKAQPDALVEGMAGALEFYADPESYFGIGFFPDRPCGEFAEDFSECEFPPGVIDHRPGKRARDALSAYNSRERATPAESFQSRVQPWMMECFGPEISGDVTERNHRFLEEALELVQSTGCTQSEAHQLVDYVFGRPAGEPKQESGGVMVTHAALCLATGMDMHESGEIELRRIWTKVDVIRAKQAAKPKHSPLPSAQPPAPVPGGALVVIMERMAPTPNMNLSPDVQAVDVVRVIPEPYQAPAKVGGWRPIVEAQTLARFILENAEKFQWSLQGLGMLRLYLPGDARLHVWDTRFAFPGASPVHDHLQWGLTSTILSGRLTNYRYREGSGGAFHWARFKAGYNAKQLHAPETILLERQPAEIYRPGDSYSQAPNEIHETQSDWGTVTLMQKRPTADGETARIFWPAGTEWGSAEPRAATPEEVKAITSYALAHLQPEPPAP